MNLYIEQGRFGEFVAEILDAEYKRKKDEADKENERMMWELYLHSMIIKESFNEWKQNVVKTPTNGGKSRDEDMNDSDIMNIIEQTLSQ